jgi:hypothetical protein
MSTVLGTAESKFGELRRERVGNFHHDVDVVRQELVAGGPEVDGHAANDDRVYAKGSRDGLDHGDDFEGPLGQIGLLGCSGKIFA